jgi:hypothetical protein
MWLFLVLFSYYVRLRMNIFCDVGPCSMEEIYRRFRGAYSLHNHQSNQRPDDKGTGIWNLTLCEIVLQPKFKPIASQIRNRCDNHYTIWYLPVAFLAFLLPCFLICIPHREIVLNVMVNIIPVKVYVSCETSPSQTSLCVSCGITQLSRDLCCAWSIGKAARHIAQWGTLTVTCYCIDVMRSWNLCKDRVIDRLLEYAL